MKEIIILWTLLLPMNPGALEPDNPYIIGMCKDRDPKGYISSVLVINPFEKPNATTYVYCLIEKEKEAEKLRT